MMKLLVLAVGMTAMASQGIAATLSQTIHYPGASADQLFDLYTTSAGHSKVTGVPAHFVDAAGNTVERAEVGGSLEGFCFQPDMCALKASVLDLDSTAGGHSVIMKWWNFGWTMALDPDDLTLEGRGAPDSTLVLTFSDTLRGAQIELVQVNVPDFKVRIPNPDGTEEIGPLSSIVDTHWNLLYWDGFRRALSE